MRVHPREGPARTPRSRASDRVAFLPAVGTIAAVASSPTVPMTPAVVLGVVLLAIYWAWVAFFFARVRPWLMARIGSRLGVRVRESMDILDAGTWATSGRGTTLPKSGLVMAADLAILLVGVVGVAALIFVPAFLLGESGALLPLEARLTGRGAEIRVPGAAEMTATTFRSRACCRSSTGCRSSMPGSSQAGSRTCSTTQPAVPPPITTVSQRRTTSTPTTASGCCLLDVANTGREALRDCYATVDGYSARNGYLRGRSARFDLAAGETSRVPIALEAMRPPPGSHAFRLKLECANERLATANAELRVR